MRFNLKSRYKPSGDQPAAIASLVEGAKNGLNTQVLLGVTGSGKTFTMANVIQELQRPALVIAHNKTLAAQLCNEFREFFPENRVEFFVSYYDYYQPESYIPSRDLYIEKDMAINDEIDKLRNSATCSLYERRDTVVVASVSCIYGLGAPEQYYKLSISLRQGQRIERNALMRALIGIQYARNDIEFKRGTFRARGDTVDIFPAHFSETAVRVEFFGDEIERICEIEAVSGKITATLSHFAVFPATHYAVEKEVMDGAMVQIEKDLAERVAELNADGKPLEAFRLNQRVNYDLEMMREIGFCKGIENYSRYFDGREKGTPPFTLLDYFPKDFITFIDESHMTVPQVRGMYHGDRSRKTNLVEYGFRLPAAYDNRPLKFDEFDGRIGQRICVSATPAPYELNLADNVAEQIIRPTGLLDPKIEVKSAAGQIDDLIDQITLSVNEKARVLVTTLTKKNAESLADYLNKRGFKIKYMHSDIDTLERIEIVNGLRRGEFDIIVGINLLREGLDLPEVNLVAILDADKEGFLRSEQALIQTVGRAARNAAGRVIMYADKITGSMQRAIDTTEKRRKLQDEYNKARGITPRTVTSEVKNSLEITKKAEEAEGVPLAEIPKEIERLRFKMAEATGRLDFELAIIIRESIAKLRKRLTE